MAVKKYALFINAHNIKLLKLFVDSLWIHICEFLRACMLLCLSCAVLLSTVGRYAWWREQPNVLAFLSQYQQATQRNGAADLLVG